MKWTFSVQQKLKLALLLMGVMVLVIVFNLIERRNIAAMNRSVTSMYNDRLLPATDIFYLTDHLYHKRFLMEKFLLTSEISAERLRKELLEHDRDIESRIERFEKTYLVDSESASLKEFRRQVDKYRRIEQTILNLWAQQKQANAIDMYEFEGKDALKNTVLKLSDLTNIQSAVAGELVDNSKGILAKSDLLSTVQLCLAIVIGVMIMSLIAASKVSALRSGDFNLN